MDTEELYPCPCCGYKTFNSKPPGTYLICPICFWEDDGETGSNQVYLRQGQRNFINFGACEQEWLSYVRSPTENDIRDSNWQPLDILEEDTRLALIAQITAAFDGIKREDGITLHEARALDDYADRQKARKLDSESQWQDVPDELIEYFFDIFAFFDAKGFRYYIPAYMIWCLKNYKHSNSNTLDYTIFVLNNRGGYYHPHFELFDIEQLQAIAAFLQFMNNFYPSTA
jgi:Cysteine-rich CPCC